MNPEAYISQDEQFASRLLECDEALANGRDPESLAEGENPELRSRLEKGLACVKLLQQLRPQRSSIRLHDLTTTDFALAVGDSAAKPHDGDPPCPTHLGRFEIRRLLGRGGFGIVYLAYDPVLCREIALKIPKADALIDAECRARFQREARATAGLDHPHLVPVHEAGQLGPVCYLALAYCPGSNLSEWLMQRKTPVALPQAARLVALLAEAVHYAHTKGILHRDLKPSNVLLTPVASAPAPASDSAEADPMQSNLWVPESGAAFLPRITDFGMAKFAVNDQGHTRTGAVVGTPSYMAPEQADGRSSHVGPVTDVYALGAILYEVITGRPPFWTDTPLETLLQVKTADPVAPGRLRPRLPCDLETICLKCLHKEPRKRYTGADALAADLRRFLAGRSIQGRRSSLTELVLRWARRRPGLAAAICALVLVTSLGIGGILHQWQAAQVALANENKALGEAQQALQAEALEREKNEDTLYHHRVALAYREWSSGNVAEAMHLLDQCDTKQRDWEWSYVHRLCAPPALTMHENSGCAQAVAFSPDGRRVASGGGKGGDREPGAVRLWDAATGQLLWTAPGLAGQLTRVSFSPDGRQLVSSSLPRGVARGQVTIWDSASGKPIRSCSEPTGGAMFAAYSPDGKRIAAAGLDKRVRLFDAATGAQVSVFSGHRETVFGLAFSPDGKLLASCGWDGTVCVWDLASGKQAYAPLAGPVDLRSVAFSPDGRRLATASFDQSVKVWDAANGQLLRTYWGHSAAAARVAFDPDGRYLASADFDGTVQLWNLQTDRAERTLRGHTGTVSGLSFSPDGHRLASSSWDGTIRLWDVMQSQEAYPLAGAATGSRNVVFSADGKLIAVAGWTHSSGKVMEKNLRVWSTADPSTPMIWQGHIDWLSCVAFAPDGKVLASGSKDRTVRLWEIGTGKTLHVLEGHKDLVTSVSFSLDGKTLASASLDKTVRLWDVVTGQPRSPVLTHPYPVKDLIYSPDGRLLVSADNKGAIRFWDAAAGSEIATLSGDQNSVERICFSPDGRWLASAGDDHMVRIWDTKGASTGKQVPVLRHLLQGHTESVTGLSFSHDNHLLASGSKDRTIRIWDLSSGAEALTLRGHKHGVNGLAFSPDGRELISASDDAINVWDAGSGAAGALPARTPAPRDVIFWHLQETEAAALADPPQWFAVAYHLERWLAIEPNEFAPYVFRADMEEALGQLLPAAEDYTRGIDLGEGHSWVWLHLAALRLHLGDIDSYRGCCGSMLSRFESSISAFDANDTAWACVLAPGSVNDLAPLIKLAERAVASDPKDAGFCNTLGAVLYRADQLETAREKFREGLHLNLGNEAPEDCLFMAMTEHRLGNPVEARFSLDQAIKRIEAEDRKHLSGRLRISEQNRRIQLQILRREAENLLTGPR